jgi:hypothetical protein
MVMDFSFLSVSRFSNLPSQSAVSHTCLCLGWVLSKGICLPPDQQAHVPVSLWTSVNSEAKLLMYTGNIAASSCELDCGHQTVTSQTSHFYFIWYWLDYSVFLLENFCLIAVFRSLHFTQFMFQDKCCILKESKLRSPSLWLFTGTY